MNGMQIVIKASGLQTLWLGIAAVLGGSAAAAAHGNFAVLPMCLCLVFAIFMQSTNNIIHTYYDIKYGFISSQRLAGKQPSGQEYPIPYILQLLKDGIYTYAVFTCTIGLALFIYGEWWFIIIGAILVAVELLNFIGKRPMIRSVLFPAITFLLFGPVGVISTELVEIGNYQDISNLLWWDFYPGVIIGFVIGIMALNCHIIIGFTFSHGKSDRWAEVVERPRTRTIATLIIIATTFTYTAIALALPHLIEVEERGLFLPIPVLSFAISIFQAILISKPGKERIAWRLSLFNIILVSLSALIIFLTIR